MQFEDIVRKFIDNPCYLTNGAGQLSIKWGVTKNTIKAARTEARERISNIANYGTEYNPKDVAFGNKTSTVKCDISNILNKNKIKYKLPKILIFDIESSPSIAYTWRRFQENISLDQVIQDPIMLTWAAKWLYSSEVLADKLTSEEVIALNDYRIVKNLWDLIDEADVVIAHYGDRFDIPMLNYRAIVNNLKPFSSVKSIDTKKVASQTFKFPSNKLDALATYFGVGNKIKTEFDLWKNCLNGSAEALLEMDIYCQQDVKVLEEVYLKLRPYIKAHPNAGVYFDENKVVCSICGGDKLKEEGYYFTNTGKFQQYRCTCGGLTRGRTNLLSKEKKKKLLTSIPR